MHNNALRAAFAEDRQDRCRPLEGRAADGHGLVGEGKRGRVQPV